MSQYSLWIKIVICVSLCMATGLFSGISTADAIQNWYSTLNKPFFNPPNWIFAPVWTLLYFLLGLAVALVWHKGWRDKEIKLAIGIFILQFAVNLIWSPTFFNLQAPTIAFIIIIILWILILLTIMRFNKVHRPAALLMIPYWLWVSFATVLNGSIVYLN